MKKIEKMTEQQMKAYWGKRCSEYYEGCLCCEAWATWDKAQAAMQFDEVAPPPTEMMNAMAKVLLENHQVAEVQDYLHMCSTADAMRHSLSFTKACLDDCLWVDEFDKCSPLQKVVFFKTMFRGGATEATRFMMYSRFFTGWAMSPTIQRAISKG